MLFYAAALQTLNYDWDTLRTWRWKSTGTEAALGSGAANAAQNNKLSVTAGQGVGA